MKKQTTENPYLLKLFIIFAIILFVQITFARVSPCKQVTHIDFRGRSISIETKDGSVFIRHLTDSEYRAVMVDSYAQDRLVNELVDGMECGKNKFTNPKEDPNL